MDLITRSPVTPMEVRRARRGLLLFGLILVPLSLLGYWFFDLTRASAPPLVPDLPLMLSPALASVITRLVFQEGFSDVSFQLGGRRALRAVVLGVAVPVVVGSLAYGLAYLLGLARFAPPALPFAGTAASSLASLVLIIVLAATLGTLILIVPAAGEEIGWRGYLLPRLIEVGAPQPVLLSGLIWGAWHLVPVLASGYAAGPSPLFSATNLMIATVSLGSILAWMRLGTGSIWPSV